MVAFTMVPVGRFPQVGTVHVRSAVVVRAQSIPPSQAPPRRQAPPSAPPSGPSGPSGRPQSGPSGPGGSRGPNTGSGVATPGQPGPPATPGGFQQQNKPGQRQSGPARGGGGYGRGRGGRGSFGGRGRGRGGPGRGPMTGGRGPMQGGRGRGRFQQPEETFENKVNMEIPFDEVRVLDKMKEMVGVMPLTEAMGMATAAGMDVILINETAQPPLVRICSVSKYKYEIEKVKKEAQKKQRASQQELKELKLSPRTEVHDLEVRKRKAHKELSKGNKVKILVAFKGREKESMIPIARKLVDQILEHVAEIASFENRPVIQGRFLACTLMPKESKSDIQKK